MSFTFPNESFLAKALREAAEAENRRKSLLLGGGHFSTILGRPIKRKVFISYHHENDQWWADFFRKTYSDQYDIFYDTSLDEEVNSDDSEYINRFIREEHIVGSSITIVLCGAETYKRRFVDWEIYSTLDCQHALLGIALPTAAKGLGGLTLVPGRLHDNIESGYAHWTSWPANGAILKSAIETAISKSAITIWIKNSREKIKRSLA